MSKRKGQLSLGDAPSIVLIIGLTFLVMATIALIGETYGDALPVTSYRVNNETLTTFNTTAQYIDNVGQCGFANFAAVSMTNASGGEVINSANYTTNSGTGTILSTSGTTAYGNNTIVNLTYTYGRAGTACNVTSDLQVEIGNNTSIAGIILTIALVGIVLTILIGVFMGVGGIGKDRV